MSEKQNIKAAEGTYSSFLNVLKLSTIVTIAITALVVVLLAG